MPVLALQSPPNLRHCPGCGYDLKGLPARHQCPECGFAFDEHTLAIPVWRRDEMPSLFWLCLHGFSTVVLGFLLLNSFNPWWLIAFIAVASAAFSAARRYWLKLRRETDSWLLLDAAGIVVLARGGVHVARRWWRLKEVTLTRRASGSWRLQVSRSPWSRFMVSDVDVVLTGDDAQADAIRRECQRRIADARATSEEQRDSPGEKEWRWEAPDGSLH